jgi:hypothetical protein
MSRPSAGVGDCARVNAELHGRSLPAFQTDEEGRIFEVVMIIGTAPRKVFDADAPTLRHSLDETPSEVNPPAFQAGQQHAPVAIGPANFRFSGGAP